jgi:cytochrome c oxidase assembly factor CtaG
MAAKIDLHFWLTAWNLTPTLWLGLIAVVGLYVYALGPYHKRAYPDVSIQRGQTIAFLCGTLIIFLSLVTPLDTLGDDYLFSAHMVQHLCLTTFGPPLLLIGLPEWMIERILNQRLMARLFKIFTWAPVAFFLYNADFLLWHAPALYTATLENETIHIFEHLTFIGFAILFWWPILSPSQKFPRLSLGGQVLYIFLSGMPAVLLGAGLTFIPPLYSPYLSAPIAWGISHATDQQLGGLIMWVPVNLFYIAVMSGLFIRWMLKQEKKQIEAERLADTQTQDALG